MKYIKILIVMFVAMVGYAYGDGINRIEIRLKNAPEAIINQCIAQQRGKGLAGKMAEENTPAQVSKKLVKNRLRDFFTPSLSGFMAIYGGYMDISSKRGLLVFPRRQMEQKIYVAIAPAVELVKVKGQTFSHRQFKLGEESKLYSFESKIDKKNIVYWHVQEEKIPENRIIGDTTLVIFAKTKNIYVPQGDFLSVESGHFLLPDIYVVGNFDQEKIILEALEFKQYFEPIVQEKKVINEMCIQKKINNI